MGIDITDLFVRLEILITEGRVSDGLIADGDVRDFPIRSTRS